MEITKQIEPLKKHIVRAEQTVNDLIIEDNESLNLASEISSEIKLIQKDLKDKKEAITKPMNDALKHTRALFASNEATLKELEDTVKSKVIDYTKEQEEVLRVERVALEEKAKSDPSKANLSDLKYAQTARKNIKSDRGSMQIKKVKAFEVIAIDKLPKEYILPNLVKIRQAMHLDIPIEGVEYKLINQVAVRN